MKVFLFFGLFFIFLTIQATTYAEENKVIFVGPSLVDCVGVGPQKCMLIKEDSSSEWKNFYDKIEGFDFTEGHSYKIMVQMSKIENPPADSSSIKYKLIEIIEEKSEDLLISYQNMCAPGYVPLGKICVLNDRCGPGAYPGKICIMDGKIQPYLRPNQQVKAGIDAKSIVCAEQFVLVFKNDLSPACVKPSSSVKLEMRGWLIEKPPVVCTLEWDPVCGIDGNTYPNVCILNEQEVNVSHKGDCGNTTEFELNEKYNSIQENISNISKEIYNGKYNGEMSWVKALEILEKSKIELFVIKHQYDSLENEEKTDRQIGMKFQTLGKMGFASIDSQINIIKNQIKNSKSQQ